MKRIAFVINGTIKDCDKLTRELEARSARMDARLLISKREGHMKELTADAVRDGVDDVVVVGGDGSLNEVVNGLISACGPGGIQSVESYDWDAVRKVRIGLLPSGSGNDFARSLEIEKDMAALFRRIRGEASRFVDVGHAAFLDPERQESTRFYINITDVGMGGETVLHMASHRVSWLSSNLNYMKAILAGFINYEKTPLKLTWEGGSWSGKVMSAVVANGKYFGSGLGVAPDALIDDGLFSLVTFGDITMLDYLKNLSRVRALKKVDHPEVTYHQIKSVTLEPAGGGDLPIDMDGEFAGYCPMTITCVPGALSFMV